MISREDGQLIGPSLGDLAAILDELGAGRVLLVVDRGALSASGAEGPLTDALHGRLVGAFSDFSPNPASDQPLEAARRAVALGADTLVAFGGGSCMDVAKVGALAAADLAQGAGIVRGSPAPGLRPLRVIAIPTTSGTGSETTHFSAVYVEGRKVSIVHPGMRPAGVILDASLHAAMPAFVAAASGLDALCQATESLWAVGATPASIAHATAAQTLAIGHLEASVRTSAYEDRAAMMHAAHLAGRAINISKTTASHALSYELTTRFGIPHGLAVALTLGPVAAFNARVTAADCQHPAGPDHIARRVGEACRSFGVGPGEMPARLRDLLKALGRPATLAEAGVDRAALPSMAEAADTVRLSNNPRRLTTADAFRILEAAFDGSC